MSKLGKSPFRVRSLARFFMGLKFDKKHPFLRSVKKNNCSVRNLTRISRLALKI